MNQQQRMIWVIGSFLALVACPAWAGAEPVRELQQATLSTPPTELEEPEGPVAEHEIAGGTDFPVLSQVGQPATTVEQWLTEIAQAIAQITAVRLEATADGVEVVLETSAELTASSSVVGNALITDIPNAVLNLPEGDEFQVANPAEGIALVSATELPGNRVRIAITGTDAPPTAQVNTTNQALMLTVAAGGAIAADTEEDAIQVAVTGEQEEGYAVDSATTATRTETPLRDIPQSIQVVPQQVLEDQQVIRASEALRNVSGVQRGNTVGGISEVFNIRGFQQFGGNLRDGFRENTFLVETANLERIEILKGPASVLYGNLDPGGIINYVTKQPLSEPFYAAALQAGSFGLVRPTIDLSGPLNPERSVLYRLNAAYERGGNFRDFDTDVERFFISPVIAWNISDRTDITFEFEYLNDQRPFDRGLVAFGTDVADIPFDRVLGELDDSSERTNLLAGYRLEHHFSDNWRLRNRFRFSYEDFTLANADPSSLNEDTGELSRAFIISDSEEETYALQTELIGNFTTGLVEHTLLLGFDLSWQTREGAVLFAEAPSINIFNPVYGIATIPPRDQFPFNFPNLTETNSFGIFLQDQVTLTENLKFLVGGRFDSIDQTTLTSERESQAFSPRVGIVYQPIEPISLYTSFSRSFQPNTRTRVDGSLLEPVRGTQYEVGVRGEFLNHRLITNLAAYEITRSNIAITDPDNPSFAIPLGEQRSRGIELDVTGEILPGWNIIASYAYTDARVTKDNNLQPGNLIEGVPFNSASLWSTYEIQTGDFQGLGFGLGLFYVGERQGDLNNSFQVPGYVRTDASVFYSRSNWRAAINVNNLFNIDYIEAAQLRTRIDPGVPLTVRGTLSFEF